jgi:hypothetical protein
MIDDLINKAKSWSLKMADNFHSQVPRVNPNKGGYIWITTNNGFYHWGPDAVDFYRHDGRVFSLQTKAHLRDWEMHEQLYAQSIKCCDFRISQPVIFKPITVNNVKWVYTEVQYPGNDIGYPAHFENLLVDPYGTIKAYVDSITVLISHLHILDSKYECKYPSKVKLGNRITDNQGFFWKDIKYWGNTWENFYTKHVGEVQKIINRLPHNGIVLDDSLAMYAAEQWAI